MTAAHDTGSPSLTRKQVRRVDELAVSRLGLPSIVLMENAGRNAAEWIARRWPAPPRRAAIWCGVGNNGGDGFVIARHLHNRGWDVRIYIVGERSKLTADAGVNCGIISAMGLPIMDVADAHGAAEAARSMTGDDIVVDALLGTGFAGQIREPTAAAIRAMNAADVRAIVAVDIPSGLDCDSGLVADVAVRAAATITFVARKRGFDAPQAREYVGEVVVADIGAPRELLDAALLEGE